MNRYGMEHYYDQGSEMVEKPDGDYVLYEDHQQAIDAELEDSATLSNRLQAVIDELQRQLAAAKNTLEQIAGSYPVTDEGETLASLARDALKELAK